MTNEKDNASRREEDATVLEEAAGVLKHRIYERLGGFTEAEPPQEDE